MPDNTYKVGIGAETTEFQQAMAKMESSVTGATATMERKMNDLSDRGFGRMERSLRNVRNMAATYLSFQGLKEVGTAAVEQERAIGELATTYQSLGIYSDNLMRNTIDLASSLQREANQADETTESNIALMTNIGKLRADQIEPATKAALGLAEMYGIDVTTAFQLVGKAAAGNTSTLSRYGVVLGDGMSKQEKFNRMLQLGASGYEQLTARIDDSGGSWERLMIYIDDAKEALGEFATSPVILEGIGLLTGLVENFTWNLSNIGIIAEVSMLHLEKAFVKTSGSLSKNALMAGQVPGAQYSGITAESIDANVKYQLGQLDRYESRIVNEWDKKQADRMKSFARRKTQVNVRDDIADINGDSGNKEKNNFSSSHSDLMFEEFKDTYNFNDLSRKAAKLNNTYAFSDLLGYAADFSIPKIEFEKPKLGAGYAPESVINPEDIAESTRITQQAEIDRIQSTQTGYEQQKALAETYYEWERDELVRKYGAKSASVQALEQAHTQEMTNIDNQMYAEMRDRNRELAENWADTLYSMGENAGWSFKGILSEFEDMIKEILIKAALTETIDFALGGTSKTGTTSTTGTNWLSTALNFVPGGNLVSGILSLLPGRATGGPVEAGRVYQVNERANQREVFVPSVNGMIYPSLSSAGKNTGGNGGGTINNTIGSLAITFTAAEKETMLVESDAKLAERLERVVLKTPRLRAAIMGRS